MFKRTMNYSTEKKEKSKKKLFAIIMIAAAMLLLTGSITAYFSDYFSQPSQLKTGSLKINAVYTAYLNDNATDLNSLNNLSPGDIIVIKGNISNIGSQSAWIRERITINAEQELLNYFKVYNTQLTRQQLADEQSVEGYLISSGTETAVGTNRVINGTGANAQIESGEDYEYIGSNSYEFYITIYFSPTATNAAQGKTFDLAITTQALQFTNNNEQEPDETAWATVEAA